MSGAWAWIVCSDGSDEWLERCNAALKEVQEETLRRAVRKQRNWLLSEGYDTECGCGGCSWCLAQDYIGLIDPDKE